MIFGMNTTHDISKLSPKFHSPNTYNNFEISLVVFIPNITTNHAFTYTNSHLKCMASNSMDQAPVAQKVDNAIL